jgi:pyruvate dehydrogenase E1 component beta subunit
VVWAPEFLEWPDWASHADLELEHAALYGIEGDLPSNGVAADIATAKVGPAGDDLSLITYGGTLFKTLEAARQLAAEGIDAEVVDLRVLRPIDETTLLESVRKTHAAVIVDEGTRSGSLSAEISARMMEGAFYDLDAPVARVCSAEVPMPYPKHLEDAALPQAGRIAQAARDVMRARGHPA